MRLIVFIAGMLTSSIIFGQDYSGLLTQYNQRHPQEKIFLHTDKEAYVAGETIWFKAYLFANGLPSMLSSNLYLNLRDAQGKTIASCMLPVAGATAKGQLTIPDSAEGAYTLCPYTATLVNFTDSSFYPSSNITVIKPSVEYVKPESIGKISIRFFPESGHLVHGITSAVAFKAINEWGEPVETKGEIRTPEGFNIPFRTTHDGMGKVSFRPDANKKYAAMINGQSENFALPAVDRSGVVLHVEDEKGGKQFTVYRSNADAANFQSLYIVGQINNQVVYESPLEFDDYPSIKGHLITEKLPSGILHFTVFNKSGIPLAERMSFVDNREYRAAASISNLADALKPHTMNSFELVSDDSLQKSVSVSITDPSVLYGDDHGSIISNMLLTSDLKGHIHRAAWYFDAPADSTRLPLDLLMMTQGWTRFKWTAVLQSKTSTAIYKDPYLLSVSGTVLDPASKPFKGGMLSLYLSSSDSSTQNYEVPVDGNGRFLLDSLLFFGDVQLHYSFLQNDRQKPAVLKLDSVAAPLKFVFLPLPLSTAVGVGNIDPAGIYRSIIESNDRTKLLTPVTVQASSIKNPSDEVNEKYTTGAFRSEGKYSLDNVTKPTPNKTINPIDYSLNNIRTLEMQKGILVNQKTMSLSSGTKWPVALFLNEAPADLGQLRNYRMDEIALIKFYEPGFVGAGSGGPGGALAIYTRNSNNDNSKAVKMDYVTANGFSVIKEFYVPQYEGTKSTAKDARSTLYWNGAIYLDGSGAKKMIRFANNDTSKKLRVTVEGITSEGKFIHIQKDLE